jgi:RNA polymerase sigma-70 factor (ECF subfamily)
LRRNPFLSTSGQAGDGTWTEAPETEVREPTDLIARCRRGDALAWEQLVRTYQGRVYGLALRYLNNPEEARDIAQEAFVRVYRRLDDFDGSRSFSGWLLLTTRNLCIDLVRRRSARPPAEDVPVGPGAEPVGEAPTALDALEAGARRGLLFRALERLTPINREIVLLKEIHGLSLEEVARALDIPVGTAKSRSSRARLELAREVLALDPSYGGAMP